MRLASLQPQRRWLTPLAIPVLLVATTAVVRPQVIGEIERLDPPAQGFFSRQLVMHGIPIMAHADVSDAALDAAARRLDRLLARAPRIAANLARLGTQLHVIGKDQACSDLPEYRHLKGKPFDGNLTIDERGRGYGGLFCSCGEENLLFLESDPYRDHRDICSHEFAHTVLDFALSPEIRDRVEAQHRQSLAAGRWAGTYAATNAGEFLAELTMWYVGSRGDYGTLDPPPEPGAHWLRRYDPEAYALLDDIYGGRLEPPEVEVTDLQSLPPEQEGQIRSLDGQPATQVIFLNETGELLRLFWLDFDGKRQSYGEVPPGAQGQSTFATHAWLVETPDGRVLGIYVPDTTIGRVIIRSAPLEAKEPNP